jgi:hypothetical protein
MIRFSKEKFGYIPQQLATHKHIDIVTKEMIAGLGYVEHLNIAALRK